MSKRKKKTHRKARRGKKYRKVYPYDCEQCGKSRIAFDHARAKTRMCRNCQPIVPDPNQAKLFA